MRTLSCQFAAGAFGLRRGGAFRWAPRVALSAMAALAMNAASAAPQDLTLYGAVGCFSGAAGSVSVTGGVSSGDCGDVAESKITWGSTLQLSYVKFERATPPGGPGDQGDGDPALLGFTGNLPLAFSLGTLTYADLGAGNFDRTYLNFSLWFTNGASDAPTFSYNEHLLIVHDTDGANELLFELPAARTFSIGARSYQFSIAGFDSSGGCDGSKTLGLEGWLTPAQTQVCASLTYLGDLTTVPEPSTVFLVAAGLIGLLAARFRRGLTFAPAKTS